MSGKVREFDRNWRVATLLLMLSYTSLNISIVDNPFETCLTLHSVLCITECLFEAVCSEADDESPVCIQITE